MDNCSIHHDEEIRKLIVEECGWSPLITTVIQVLKW